jgi:hypothetical protein
MDIVVENQSYWISTIEGRPNGEFIWDIRNPDGSLLLSFPALKETAPVMAEYLIRQQRKIARLIER